MPFLYKRNRSPFWYVGFTEKEKELGFKPYSTKSKNKKFAEMEVEKQRKLLDKAQYEGATEPARKTLLFSDALKKYYASRKSEGKPYSDLTLQNYSNALNFFWKACEDKPVSEYTRQDYLAFYEAMGGLKQNSQAVYSKCIFAVFSWLVKEEIISKNPMRRVAEKDLPVEVPSKEDIQELLKYAKNTKFYNLCRFMILSAFRPHEAVKLKASDIKLDQGVIDVLGKGNKYAFIVITSEMRKFLSEIEMEEDLFPFSLDAVFRFFSRFRKQSGIEMTAKSLRKSCISEFANSGVPINFTKEYARHSSILTTMKYYIRADATRMLQEIDKKVTLIDTV